MAIRFIKIAVFYLACGICLGLYMGMTTQFTLAPVHAHLNLLGFAVMTLAGLVYRAFPEAAETRLAKVHFWLHNVGLPPLMISLALMLKGNAALEPVVGITSMVVGAGVFAFIINVWLSVRAPVASGGATRAALATS